MASAEIHALGRWSRRVGGEGFAKAIARLASGLCLAATPTFAAMALLTGLHGGSMETLCSAAGGPLGGMIPMYLLMSAFHAPSWLRLIWLKLNSRRHDALAGVDPTRAPTAPDLRRSLK